MVSSAAAFNRWASTDLQTCLPHGLLMCGVAELRQRDFKPHKLLPGAWPAAYLEALRRSENGLHCPLMARWVSQQTPQFHDAQSQGLSGDPSWTQLSHELQLGHMALHGQRDIDSPMSSFFLFARMPDLQGSRHARLLELLVPQMHVALLRCLPALPVYGAADLGAVVRLTPRERVVLGWMIEGKTNWEIAQIGGRSEHTVRHQVARLLSKLKASNRAQAVAKAIALKLHL